MPKKYTHRLTIVDKAGGPLHDQKNTIVLEKDYPIVEKDALIEVGYEIERKDGSKSYSWITLRVTHSRTKNDNSSDIFLTCTPTAKNGGVASVKRLIEYRKNKKQ